jgi:SAM-dependent methyltransferase
MEQAREAYWSRYPATAPVKLRWRAVTVRHAFHVLPGESILEIGAGSGLWTEQLSGVFRGRNPITAAVFNEDLAGRAENRNLPGVRPVHVADLGELPAESFDYVIGTAILCHDEYRQNLHAIHRLLKPGGQLLFFENNYWNPQVWLKNVIPAIGRWAGNAPCQVGIRKFLMMQMASHQGFTHVDVIPYDIVHPRTPARLISALQTLAFFVEHVPLVNELCGTLYIWAKKPGSEEARRPSPNLAVHERLRQSTSVVVPCHNEEATIPRLVASLLRHYGDYIHEIVIVNDNSTDGTSAAAREIGRQEPRVKVVDRTPPNGVGRALRDGIAAATGEYILIMDADFMLLVPELSDMFDQIAAGHHGAIGSRFSQGSILVNYPFFKILCNRAFHVLANLVVDTRIRDVSNNLKLYRADILKKLDIEEPHFAANAETGLKPILLGYDIQEVPVSWVNRTVDMGSSSFRIVKVAPNYFQALVRIAARRWMPWRTVSKLDRASTAATTDV